MTISADWWIGSKTLMGCASLFVSMLLPPPPYGPSALPIRRRCSRTALRILCSSSNSDVFSTAAEKDVSMTGGAYDFKGATTALTNELLSSSKKVTLVRHGLSSWNGESRIQSSAELIWEGREQPLVFLDTLKEAHLFFLEGMKNADAKKIYPELYTAWREDPANFHVDGIYPVQKLWGTAREAWREILSASGENLLVVTHKSILRALICTALGLGPERFRAVDINNGGISVFIINRRGEPMLQALNMTAHMHSEYIYEY